MRPHAIAEEIQRPPMAAGDRENLRLAIELELEAGAQPGGDLAAPMMQLRLVRMHDDKVVHIADIAPGAQGLLGEFVQLVQIDIGPELADQVADRQTVAPGGEDVAAQGERARAANAAREQAEKNASIDAGEILAYVGLEHVRLAIMALDVAQPLLRRVGAGMHALARPAGIAVVDEARLPNRLQRRMQRVLHDTVAKRQRGDQALFGLVDVEQSIRSGL